MGAYTILSEFFFPLAYGICRELPHFLYVLFLWKVNFEKKHVTSHWKFYILMCTTHLCEYVVTPIIIHSKYFPFLIG